MEAIKKKMQAMKLEKDNAMDRADTLENQAKEANLRAERSEEELRALQKKMQQLENDFDLIQEQLTQANARLEEKDKSLQNVNVSTGTNGIMVNNVPVVDSVFVPAENSADAPARNRRAPPELHDDARRRAEDVLEQFGHRTCGDGSSSPEKDDSEWTCLRCSSARAEASQRPTRKRRCADYPGLDFASSLFSSSTFMKFSVIKNELHNIKHGQLKQSVSCWTSS